jgi:hypothetical protein
MSFVVVLVGLGTLTDQGRKRTSKLEVLVEAAEVEHGNHCASSVGDLLRTELIGWVAELKRGCEAIEACEDTAIRAVVLDGAATIDVCPFVCDVLVAKLHLEPLACQSDVAGTLAIVI